MESIELQHRKRNFSNRTKKRANLDKNKDLNERDNSNSLQISKTFDIKDDKFSRFNDNNLKNVKNNNISNHNMNNTNVNIKDSSRSINNLLNQKSLFSSLKKNEDDSLINISCEALYYYLKEKGYISNSKIFLLSLIVYIAMMILHNNHILFFLITRPLYTSYLYECYTPNTKSIAPCTSRNVCFCEDLGRCVTLTYYSEISNSKLLFTSYDDRKNNTSNYQLKFKFGEINNFLMYDQFENSISKIVVNFSYKKNEKFCILYVYSFVGILTYCFGGLISDLIFGYLSDLHGRFKIINILSILFCVMQIVYFFLFFYIEKINQINVSLLIWSICSFFMGVCTLPLKSFILQYFHELYPIKDEIFGINGIIHSGQSVSYIINYLFIGCLGKITYLLVLQFLIFLGFLIVFKKYFSESPRFYSESRFINDKKINRELKKFACLQIIDMDEISNKNLTMNKSNLEMTYLSSKKQDSYKKKEENIFKKEEIMKNIAIIRKNERIEKKKRNSFRNKYGNGKWKNLFCCRKNSNTNFTKMISQEEELNQKSFGAKKLKKSYHETYKEKNVNNKSSIKKNCSEDETNFASSPIRTRRKSKIQLHLNDNFIVENQNIIDKLYSNDLYVKKYIFTYLLIRFCFAISFNSNNFFIINRINDPNLDNSFKEFGFLFLLFLITKLAYIFIGKVAFFINSRMLIFISLFSLSLMLLIIDINLLYVEPQKTLYFGHSETFYEKYSNKYLRLVTVSLINIIYSLFEVSIVSYPPTIFRGRVLSFINSFSYLSPMVNIIAVYLIDAWSIYEGIICLIALILYFTRLNDKNLEILESTDESYISKKKSYINKRLSKIGILENNFKNK